MINLHELSKVGIGAYRMTSANTEHTAALEYALEKGINLIDTASNYQFGNSEKLIGDTIKNIRKNIFLISKAGYIQGSDIHTYSSSLNNSKTTKINDKFYYSIDTSFLKKQVEASLNRLNTDYLDGFLIHNPEHYFDVKKENKEYIYSHIEEACVFLEGLVAEGLIRYYGISSNVLPQGVIDLKKIVENNCFINFRLVQFPYNLVENQATSKKANESLVDFCKTRGIKTFGNRPLNTKHDNKVLRLADYSDEYLNINFKEEEALFEDFLSKIKNQLQKYGEVSPLESFTPIQFFILNRKKIANPEAVSRAVKSHLLPFVKMLKFSDSSIEKTIIKLSEYWVLYSKKYITERSKELKEKLKLDGIIKNNDSRKISVIACENYLSNGIDHVLVGMRKKKYVDDLLSLV
jgi:aryl-alcohol dehydrogenase-like predicted oxidoreductase